MFLLGILCTLLAIASAETNVCYNDAVQVCSPIGHILDEENPIGACNSKYGSIDNLLPDLQAYATGHIEISFEFLLMSSYFGNFKSNRDGFKALYRKYSDEAWEKAINIIQYITKRGGEMNFNQPAHFRKDKFKDKSMYDLGELQSLAKALDMQKQMATEALNLHNAAKNHKDAAVAHYIEEEFIEKQSEVVRTLAGYTSDLKNLLQRDSSLGFFLFNDYIKSSI